MAEIKPFKGLLYNPDKIQDMADVLTPPYDVISKEEQEEFYNRHPNSIIRLILGKTTEDDTEKNNPHTRAAEYFKKWASEKVLVEDDAPALYLTAVTFSVEDKTVTRYGLISLVGLEPFEKGIVLPHEKTFSKVKSERLGLIKACRANFSQIFSLFSDRTNIMKILLGAVEESHPDIDLVDDKGSRHKLWRITDSSVLNQVSDAMKDRKIYIADGHHRYETSLNYRKWLSENDPDFSPDHPANYVMMYLCSMEDPGLVILPAHRLLTEMTSSELSAFIEKAEEYFEIESFSFKEKEREGVQKAFMAALESHDSENAIGALIKNRQEFNILVLKPGVMERLFEHEMPDSLRCLDVSVLTRLIFMEILGFDQERLDNENLINYSSNEKIAIDTVASGRYNIVFILNPTKIEQVRRVAEEGYTMPRKATYFYPKVITGQVLYKLY